MGVGFQPLAEILTEQFMRKGRKVVTENLDIARAGYDYAAANFQPLAHICARSRYPIWTGKLMTSFAQLAIDLTLVVPLLAACAAHSGGSGVGIPKGFSSISLRCSVGYLETSR